MLADACRDMGARSTSRAPRDSFVKFMPLCRRCLSISDPWEYLPAIGFEALAFHLAAYDDSMLACLRS